MKLIPLQTMLDAIGFEQGAADVQILAALHSATSDLEGELRTSFERVTLTDEFFIPMNRVLKYTHGSSQARLALSQGMLTGAPVVKLGYTRENLAQADPMDALNYRYNTDLGSLVILDVDLEDALLSVTYTAGLEPDTTDPDLYKQDQVPSWLKEAAKLQAILSLDTANPTLRQNDQVPRDPEILKNMIATRIGAKIRYFPSAIYPVT